jgi:hypothetical protein
MPKNKKLHVWKGKNLATNFDVNSAQARASFGGQTSGETHDDKNLCLPLQQHELFEALDSKSLIDQMSVYTKLLIGNESIANLQHFFMMQKYDFWLVFVWL